LLSFSGVAHQYRDNPTGQPNGSFPISVTVADKDGGVSPAASTSVTVNNVAPANVSLSLSDSSKDEDSSTTLGGSVTDSGRPDATDAHTVTMRRGDGSASTTVSLAAGLLSFGGVAHQYLDSIAGDGAYAISVTVADKDGGVSSAATSVAVNNVAPANVTLSLS